MMNNFFLILFCLLGGFRSVGQLSEVKILGSITKASKLEAQMTFSITGSVDSLKIFKLSAGKNNEETPNINILSIAHQNEKIPYKEDEEWILLTNSRNLKKFTITYELNLNNIFDWRKSYGYAIFPGTYLDKCWYPDIYINGERNFHKSFKVELRHPKELELLTSGTLIKKDTVGNNNISYFEANDIRYYGLNAGWNFIHKTISNGTTELTFFCSKEMETKYDEIATIAMEAIDWYTAKYGFFPKKSIGLASGHPKWHGGFPSENVFYIHKGNLKKSFIQWITAHELGHYYWGLYTLSATQDELSPLMLSNGIWMDHLFLSEMYEKPFDEIWQTYTPQAAMIEKYLATCLSNFEQKIGYAHSEFRNLGFDYNSYVAHGKAAVGIYLISKLVGEKKYMEIQRQLLQEYKEKPLSKEDYILFLKNQGYAFAEKFMEQWYKDHAIIEYDTYDIKTNQNDGKWKYSFEVRKKGTVDYPIDILVIDESGEEYYHKTKADNKKEIITGVSKSKPIDFKMDPNGKVPMWNSDNIAIQRTYILALYRAGKTKIAKKMATQFIQENPGDEGIDRIQRILK